DPPHRFPSPQEHFEAVPVSGNAGCDTQAISCKIYPQNRFNGNPVHPTGRAGVPCPSSPSDVRRITVYIGSHDVWFNMVLLDSSRIRSQPDWIQHLEQFAGLSAVSQARVGKDDPQGRMRVLSPVFAHAWQIAFDVSRVKVRLVEGRGEEQHL